MNLIELILAYGDIFKRHGDQAAYRALKDADVHPEIIRAIMNTFDGEGNLVTFDGSKVDFSFKGRLVAGLAGSKLGPKKATF